ncbi:unnamed protein product [Pedinophyceae sp. YPF-701]|nr:unnamed protein product [Pedinophyceae sp. YPF-701]
MGVVGLWACLEEYSSNTTFHHGEVEEELRAAKELDGKVVAIDTSIWVYHSERPDPGFVNTSGHSGEPTASVVTLARQRVANWLRYGITPVAVLEGAAPLEKLETLNRRREARGLPVIPRDTWERETRRINAGGARAGRSNFADKQRRIADLFEALGLPVIRARGEAEATCAALCKRGFVDAVASPDADALLHGAPRVYRKSDFMFDASSAKVKNREVMLQYFGLREIRQVFGLVSGGSEAAMAFSLLTGTDYDNMKGVHGVGEKSALRAISHLAAIRKHINAPEERGGAEEGGVYKVEDEGLVDDLMTLIREVNCIKRGDKHGSGVRGGQAWREWALQVAQLVTCTGCSRCGHETSERACGPRGPRHSTKHRCDHCVRAGLVIPRGKGCADRQHARSECECTWHRREPDRNLYHVVCDAAAGGLTHVHAMEASAAVYREQQRLAGQAIDEAKAAGTLLLDARGRLCWYREPSVQRMQALLRKVASAQGDVVLQWCAGICAEFSLRLLALRRGGVGNTPPVGLHPDVEEQPEDLRVRFEPKCVVRPVFRGLKVRKLAALPEHHKELVWRFIVEWDVRMGTHVKGMTRQDFAEYVKRQPVQETRIFALQRACPEALERCLSAEDKQRPKGGKQATLDGFILRRNPQVAAQAKPPPRPGGLSLARAGAAAAPAQGVPPARPASAQSPMQRRLMQLHAEISGMNVPVARTQEPNAAPSDGDGEADALPLTPSKRRQGSRRASQDGGSSDDDVQVIVTPRGAGGGCTQGTSPVPGGAGGSGKKATPRMQGERAVGRPSPRKARRQLIVEDSPVTPAGPGGAREAQAIDLTDSLPDQPSFD